MLSGPMRAGWIPSLLLAAVACAQCATRQELPVSVQADAVSRELRWSDPAGLLAGEVPWVLRSDLLGPGTWLVVERKAGEREACAKGLRFRMLAQQRIEYRVQVTSDLAGALSWNLGYGDGRTVSLRSCIPRPSQDRRACLRGGIPKPLMELLQGSLEARLVGADAYIPVQVARFANAPECGRAGAESGL